MPGRFSATLLHATVNTTTDGTNAVGEIVSAATVRPALFEATIGQGGAYQATDVAVRWIFQRITVSGTGTAIAENALDPAWATLNLATCKETMTAQTGVTATAEMFETDLNQKATYRWVAYPESEIKMPATAGNGLVFNASSTAYAGIARATIMWFE